MSVGPPKPPGPGEPFEGLRTAGHHTPTHEPEAGPTPSESAPVPVERPTATPDTDANTEDAGTPVTPNPPDPDEESTGIGAAGEMFGEFDDDEFRASLPDEDADYDPFPPEDVDEDAEEMDYESARMLFSVDSEKLWKITRRTPSADYVYVEELNAPVSVKEMTREYEREMAKRAASRVIEIQSGGDILSALESAMEIDHSEILDEVLSEDYDEFDRIIVGHRQRDLKLIGKDHMVRLLAQKKAGKTTSVMEIMRCSITGEHVFGAFEIQPIAEDETILFIDPELSPEDYKAYVRTAFAGMTGEEVNRIKRYSTRNQHVGERTAPGAPTPAVFDLSSEATRDALIKICNAYNVARIVFDSYVKLIPGSVNKDDDVKRMLTNWATIQGSTNVRESFWVGHINNSGEVRSSGSMLLDGTFESLLAITVDATGRRFLQAQAGRQVDELEPVEIIVNKELLGHSRPYINLDSEVKPVIEEVPGAPGARPAGKSPKEPIESKAAKVASTLNDQVDVAHKAVRRILGKAGAFPTKDGAYLRGGYAKKDLVAEVNTRWAEFHRWVPVPAKATTASIIDEMLAKGALVNEHPPKGVKVLWLSPESEAQYLKEHPEDFDE